MPQTRLPSLSCTCTRKSAHTHARKSLQASWCTHYALPMTKTLEAEGQKGRRRKHTCLTLQPSGNPPHSLNHHTRKNAQNAKDTGDTGWGLEEQRGRGGRTCGCSLSSKAILFSHSKSLCRNHKFNSSFSPIPSNVHPTMSVKNIRSNGRIFSPTAYEM